MSMFEWKSRYHIGVDVVDEEHRTLFQMLNEVAEDIAVGKKDEQRLSAMIDDIVTYAKKHFSDEEAIMAESGVDARHVKRQKMEHHSFLYDIDKMRTEYANDETQERLMQLVQFFTSWLVFHTLRTDQQLGIQLREIKSGRSPEEAYDLAEHSALGAALYRPIVDALIHLWSDAMDRVKDLEQQLQEKAEPRS